MFPSLLVLEERSSYCVPVPVYFLGYGTAANRAQRISLSDSAPQTKASQEEFHRRK
jgi:hypothetical protein